jgi:hypothetical protein
MASLVYVGHGEDQSDTSSYSLATQPTGTAGTKRWVGIWGRKNSAGDGIPATCSVGGESLTAVSGSSVVGNISTDNTSFGARWFVGDVPVGGNQTIAFTFTADGGGGAAATMIRAGYVIYEGDDFSETPENTGTDEATATNDRTLAATLSRVSGGAYLLLGGISSTANITCTLTNISTEDADFQESSANNNIVAGHSNALSAGSDDIDATWAAGGTTDDAFLTILSLAPSGAQTLEPPLFTNTNTFFTQQIERTISAPFFVNSQTFFTQQLALNVTLEPPFFINDQAFFNPTIERTISAPFFQNDQTFFTQQVIIHGQWVPVDDSSSNVWGTIPINMSVWFPVNDSSSNIWTEIVG